MAREEDRSAPLGSGTQKVAEPALTLRVETVGGLIEYQYRWVGEQGLGDAETLLHTERIAANAPACLTGGQPDLLEDLVRSSCGQAEGEARE